MPPPIFIWTLPTIISIILLLYATRNSELFIPMKKDEFLLYTEIEQLKELLIEMTINWKEAEKRITQQQILVDELKNDLRQFKIKTAITKVNILVIAVNNTGDLDVDAEIAGIFNSGIDYNILQNEVTKSAIIKELNRKSYEIIHVISHSDEKGIHLTDDIAEPGWWLRLKNQYEINLLFLNSCKTLSIIDKFSNANCAIGTSGNIKDSDAILFSKDFYGWFAQGYSITKSYDLAKLSLSTKSAQLIRKIGKC